MDTDVDFNGLRTQILGQSQVNSVIKPLPRLTSRIENYRLISPANADTLIIIEYRKKTPEESRKINYQGFNNLNHQYCALLVTHPSKGNKVLLQGAHPTIITPEASLRVLFELTCESVAGVIAAKYK